MLLSALLFTSCSASETSRGEETSALEPIVTENITEQEMTDSEEITEAET